MNWMYTAFSSTAWTDIFLAVFISIIILSMAGGLIAFFWVANIASTELNVTRKHVRKKGK